MLRAFHCVSNCNVKHFHGPLKVEHRHSEERQRRDKLSQELLGLVEQQRRYVAAVRQLTIECRRNEALLAQLRGT
jgi:hypothetical protein